MRITPVVFNNFLKTNFTYKNNSVKTKLTPLLCNDVFFKGSGNNKSEVEIFDKEKGENIKATLQEIPFDGKKIVYKISLEGKTIGISEISMNPKNVAVPRRYEHEGFLYINLMKNQEKEKYGNVGVELHKAAVKKSIEYGFMGNIALSSTKSARSFHKKCGFVELPRMREEETGHIYMYLPKKNIEKLLAKNAKQAL